MYAFTKSMNEIAIMILKRMVMMMINMMVKHMLLTIVMTKGC